MENAKVGSTVHGQVPNLHKTEEIDYSNSKNILELFDHHMSTMIKIN